DLADFYVFAQIFPVRVFMSSWQVFGRLRLGLGTCRRAGRAGEIEGDALHHEDLVASYRALHAGEVDRPLMIAQDVGKGRPADHGVDAVTLGVGASQKTALRTVAELVAGILGMGDGGVALLAPALSRAHRGQILIGALGDELGRVRAGKLDQLTALRS